MEFLNENFVKVVLKPFENEQNNSLANAMNLSEIGLMKWDYKSNSCFINDYMVKTYNLDLSYNISVKDYLSLRLDDNSLMVFSHYIYEIRKNKKTRSFDFPVKRNDKIRWYSVKLSYNEVEDASYGIIQLITERDNLRNEKYDNLSLLEQFIKELPVSLFLVDESRNLKIANDKYCDTLKNIHELIEKMNNGIKVDSTRYNFIEDIELFDKGQTQSTYRVKYKYEDIMHERLINRREVHSDDVSGILYTHQPIKTGSVEEERLQKILRANQLIMEVRDIVDHVNDLPEMFNFLLSKINTVIPAANRSCILRLDDRDRLYLDSSYGFEDEYIDEFRLPFKESYAYMHMQNDYSKSVIIDDIQLKYSDLFPDLKEGPGFKIQSNVTTPLVVNGVLYGIISVDSDENFVFDDVDLNLLDFMKIQLERAIEKYRTYRNIKRDSMLDSLTGVANRRSLMETLPLYQERAKNEDKPFLFVVFDLDQLKAINDNYGHVYGDMVIKQFAFVIQSFVRDSDFLARIGGDEFVGLFYNVNESILENRILEWETYLEKHKIIHKEAVITTKFSYGIAKFPYEGVHFSQLLEIADKRMYRQKRSKRRRNS